MASVTQSWRIIEEVLWENAHSVYCALRKPASPKQIANLSKVVANRLPKDFVKSLQIHDGLKDSYLGPIRLFDYYSMLPVTTILSEYRKQCNLQAEYKFGGNSVHDEPRIRNEAHWRKGWISIMDADGDKIILDLDPGPGGTCGQVFEWSNSGGRPSRILATSFGEWLTQFAERLEKRQFRLSESGGVCLGNDQ